MNDTPTLTTDPWLSLKRFTPARIAMGRAGVSIPTRDLLAFRLDHANARDAVHIPLDVESLAADMERLRGPVHILSSQARDRQTFLKRPDLGRKLSGESVDILKNAPVPNNPDISIVVSEGLSALAIERNALPFLEAFLPLLDRTGLKTAPITLVRQGRVAVADEVCLHQNARLTAMLIGERPGLSSPDSMGIYMTYGPTPETRDDKRNCISNIRDEGFPPADAARKLIYLIGEAMTLKLSGVNLKDRQEAGNGLLPDSQ
jgi:ethanolamine ammonia-lyase small subunit